MLFDLETYAEIPVEENSTWVEEHICFINITDIQTMTFPTSENAETEICSILAFDESDGEFNQQQIEIRINDCFDSPCSVKLEANSFQNGTVLNGTSVVCERSGNFGVVSKSEYFGFEGFRFSLKSFKVQITKKLN